MNGDACQRAGCKGRMDEGYCDLCGHSEERSFFAASTQKMSTEIAEGQTSEEAVARYRRSAQAGGRARRPSHRTARKELGAGLLSLPELPSVEPEQALLAEPRVPEGKRFCGQCDAPLRREAGFCGKCGTRYSLVPTLHAGEIVAGQYEVLGPLAYGGLGWLYLAFDRLLSRHVVLKGLLNTHDASAASAAVAERQFLASLKHPNIVGIYNFVQWNTEGFIVMEYVGGKTLKQIRQERGPLPPAEALAYLYRILPAFAYLHGMGLVFCDFKPDNVMLERDELKLIDLGGVRRIGDPHGDVYGTVGYSAPEGGAEPSPASDLFTVGRTLAVLVMEISGFGKERRYTLPARQERAVLARYESLYRLLLKATAEHPEDRFQSADEMAEQALGVLREVVARESGVPRPGASVHFGGDPLALEGGEATQAVVPHPRFLPIPSVDTRDPAAQEVGAALLTGDTVRRAKALRGLCKKLPESTEASLRLAATLTDAETFAEAETLLHSVAAREAWEWRVQWFEGLLRLRQFQPERALPLFDQVMFDLPGELPPKLAVGFAAEMAGELPLADRMYGLVATVDPSLVSAVFGMARCRWQAGDRQGAVGALQRIPPSSALHVRAQVEAVRILLCCDTDSPEMEDVLAAAAMVERLPLTGMDRLALHRDVLRAALAGAGAKRKSTDGKTTVLGCALEGKALRAGLERTLRAMAQGTSGPARQRLIDEANQVRPRTLV